MPEHTQLRVLRLAGADAAEVTRVLRAAAAEGCPGLRLLEKDGEYAVCITARAESALSAAAICDTWEKRLRPGLGQAVFTVGEKSLANTVVSACAAGQKLFVAADGFTAGCLEPRLKGAEDAHAVYDFGALSYAHPKKAGRIEVPRWAEKKYPGQPLQASVGLALAALRVSGADYGLAVSPAGGGQPAAALLCTPKLVWAVPLPEGPSQPGTAATALLDLVRRKAGSLSLPAGGAAFAPGKPAPQLKAPAQPQQPAASPKPASAAAPQPAAPPAAPTQDAAGMAQSISESIAAQKTALLGGQPAQEPPASGETVLAGPAETQNGPADDQSKEQASSQERMADAAHSLFAQPEEPAGRESEAPGAGRILLCALAVALVAGACALFGWLGQNSLALLGAQPPAWRSYGTADFDTAAQNYLLAAREQNAGAAAYLALSGQPGALIYEETADTAPAHPGAVLAADDSLQGGFARFAGQPTLGKAHSNTLLYCPAAALEGLGGLDEEAVLAENCGFTLYDGANAYRYKVAAVFYWDPAETGEAAFALGDLKDLSNYRDYLSFVLGVKARSIFEMPVDLAETDTFATLVADAHTAAGGKLVVVGRQQRPDETAILTPRGITSALQPLYTAAQYAASGEEPPRMDTLAQYWMNWYITGAQTGSDLQESAGMPQEDPSLEELLQESPTPEAPEEPDEPGDEPEATPSASPSPAPTDTPSPTPGAGATPAPTPEPPPELTPEPTPQPTPEPPPQPTPEPPPAGKTINVTMNGTAQTMDLIECLAMVVQNELGYNQPAEAYKAQAVATHSWILNQGGYPAVSGRSPSQAVLSAVQEVADQVLTYNGAVAFTPYFASAAFGTCSSAEVWGGSKPYLVAVESPYDQQYASNWQNTREYTAEEVRLRAQDKLGVDLAAYSDNPADWLGDLAKNSSGYVSTLRVGDTTITGYKLRMGVLNNVNGKTLRSTAFDLSYDESRGVFVFTTYGYGHGCGLSQWGAVGYAHNGWGYADILYHYFPGTSLSSI